MTKPPVVVDPGVVDRLVLDDQALNNFHKEQLAKVVSDKSLLEGEREAQRLEWVYRRDLRIAHENVLKAKAVREGTTVDEVTATSRSKASAAHVAPLKADRTCRDCGVVLVPSGKRGKPAVRCPDCRDGKVQAVAEKTTVNTCKGCQHEFPKTGKRGRQPSLCASCKASEVQSAEQAGSPKVAPKNVCKDCSKAFPNTGKRGRQPVKCPKCKAKEIAA